MNKVYCIGNAHLDPVWLWEWYEGYAEVKATFRSALDRMKEFPAYKFTSACAAYYEWVRDSDPAMFDEIRERVREGRWSVTGGWYIQPDCNIPSGESFARHALISQRFFREEFGKAAETGYNVDSFGHNGSLPMILRQSGMKHYVFMRPGPHEKPQIPDSLFLWQSADGSSVPTYRIPIQYNFNLGCFDNFEKVAGMASEHAMMAFYGVGNHGGGPTIRLLERMEEELDDRFVYATADEYFDAVRDLPLPVVKEDLQFHAKGCYSACSMIKKNNRISEHRMAAAEAYSVLSGRLAGTTYPSAEFERAWKNVLFNQFHDIMGGCSIRPAYDQAAMQHGEVQAIADRAENFACQQISWRIDTVGDAPLRPDKPGWGAGWTNEGVGTPIVVFNSHPWDVTAFVTVHDLPKRVTDENGVPLPCQSVRSPRTNGRNDKWEIGFLVTIPALGYKTLRAFYQDEAEEGKNPFAVGETFIENDRIRLTFDPATGELVSMTEKGTGRELLSGPTETVLMDETDSDTWAHGIKAFRKVAEVFRSGEIKVIESGPVRATVRTWQRGEHTVIRRDYSLVAGSDQVTVRTKVDFREHHRMLKFRIPTAVQNPKILCEIPFGTIERPADGSEQVCHRWFAATDPGQGGEGLAVLNDAKYSFAADGSVLELTVLRGAIWADHFGTRDEFCEYMDQGEHEFTYALMPYRSVYETTKRAAELNQKPFAVLETFHKGPLPQSYSGIRVPDGILVTAVKKHEDSDAVTVRAYECEGKDTETGIELFGTKFEASFGHNGVKTFIIGEDGVRETDFLED
ncbi:MAG: alpha-mannosidase [Ruminococcaceae bacterium]|jgi:alpha-mannosidase|nr:alpha-mannosidase [Oscillospiraceae bacterium]